MIFHLQAILKKSGILSKTYNNGAIWYVVGSIPNGMGQFTIFSPGTYPEIFEGFFIPDFLLTRNKIYSTIKGICPVIQLPVVFRRLE